MPIVGHLGLQSSRLIFRDIEGSRHKHNRDVRKGRDINLGFIHAKTPGRPRVSNVLLIAEGRWRWGWSVIELCNLWRRAIDNSVFEPRVFGVIHGRGGIDGRKLK
jgi:hypothetical protein